MRRAARHRSGALSVLLGLLLVGAALLPRPGRAQAAPSASGAGATEWVLILDNSASMAVGSKLRINSTETMLPPADPDRLSVLATLIFRGLLSPDDKLTILTFDSSGVGRYRELPATPTDIRALAFNQSTPFTGPLRRAREILTQSRLPSRRLLLFTDGAPSEDDPLTPQQARVLLGLPPQNAAPGTTPARPPFEVMSLSLSANVPQLQQMQQIFLSALGPVRSIGSPREIITGFTDVLAAHLQSRPLTGRLEPGATYSFPVGKYVTEVLVSMASEQRMPLFSAQLIDGSSGGGRALPVRDEAGDNGCDRPPCHTYRILRSGHDPDVKSRLSLRLVQAQGPVLFGIILRYDLLAAIEAAPTLTRVGEEFEVTARMVFRGRTFNDADFFATDGFSAQLELGRDRAPLVRRPDGTFVGRIKASDVGDQPLIARFANQWLQLAASAPLSVQGWLPLSLKVSPDPIDFGRFTGERTPKRRCVTVSLAGSVNADRVPLEAVAVDLPERLRLVASTPLTLQGESTELCLEALGCCGAMAPGPTTRILLRGQDPHYHPEAFAARVAFTVDKTPFLVCWWRVLAAVAGGLLLVFILVGLLKPYDFDAMEVIRLAKTETALPRTTGRRLRDLPGGKRGFYRHARVAFDSAGNTPQRLRDAAIIVRAAKGDPLIIVRDTVEHKDPRTRKWEPLPTPLPEGALRRGIVYRTGNIYFRLG